MIFFFRKICSLGDGLHGKADGSILKKIQKLIKYFEKNKDKLFEFNLNNTVDSFKQILDNYNNKKDTWAIFWNANIFMNNAFMCFTSQKYSSNQWF